MADLYDEDGAPRGPQSFEEDVPCIRCLGSTGRAETDPDPLGGLCPFCRRFLDGTATWDPAEIKVGKKEKPDAEPGV